MAFERARVSTEKPLTEADVVTLSRIEKQYSVPIPFPDRSIQVCVFMLPGVSGMKSELDSLGTELLKLSKEDNECALVKLSFAPQQNQLSRLPFTANAAFVRTDDELYYINKMKNEFILLNKLTRESLALFDKKMKVDQLGLDKSRKLSEDDLKTITKITDQIHENRRSALIYKDTNIFAGWYKKDLLKLENESISIAQAMEQKLPYGPFVLVAYSYSALLAIEIMQYFAKKKLDCFVYIIDSPAPELSRQFLSGQSEAYAQNLQDVMNNTARLTGKDTVSLNQRQIEEYRKYPAAECLEKIARLSPDNNRNVVIKNAFESLIDFEKKRLDKLANYKKEFEKPLPGKIRALITNETAEKYNNKFGGWIGYVNPDRLSFEEDQELLSLGHQELVQKKNAAILARSINKFVEENITAQYLFDYSLALKVNSLYEQTQKAQDRNLTETVGYLQSYVERKYSPTSTTPQSNGSPRSSMSVTPREEIPSNVASPAIVRSSTSALMDAMQTNRAPESSNCNSYTASHGSGPSMPPEQTRGHWNSPEQRTPAEMTTNTTSQSNSSSSEVTTNTTNTTSQSNSSSKEGYKESKPPPSNYRR